MAESPNRKQSTERLISLRGEQFISKLSQIGTQITKEELERLKFLCVELIPDGEREKIKTAEMCFEKLRKLKKLSQDDNTFLVKLLQDIGRLDLAIELEQWSLNENTKEVFTCRVTYLEFSF